MQTRIMRDVRAVQAYYARNKKKVLKFIALALLFLFAAMAIVGFRVLYPHHFLFALPFLVLGARYGLSALLIDNNKITRSATFLLVKRVIIRHEKWVFVVGVIGILFYIGSQILPRDQNPFEQMSSADISAYVDQSVDVAAMLVDALETTGNELLGSGLLEKQELTADELSELQTLWNRFLSATQESEKVTDIHRYFSRISYFSMPNEHTKSFVVAYALYLKKFELFGRVIDTVDSNDRVVKALNEYSYVFGSKDAYYNMRDRHVGHETLLRRNLGRVYAWFLEHTIDDTHFGENYATLLREGKESYQYIITHTINTAKFLAVKYRDDVENGLFNAWFPIQKNVADAMGKINVSSRESTFITVDQIVTMKPFLRPGDILIERRNWHASNVGIPGFWPHAALYIGTLEDSNMFFQELFPRQGYESYAQFIEGRYPTFYAMYKEKDGLGYPRAVIEGQAPGIILQSLEVSATADYLGVLRPRLTKEDVLSAVIRSFENYGKPYDYNFDFETRDEIVCSELVYDAYLSAQGKEGVNFKLSRTAGRKMISPNDMVRKFYEERGTANQELDFVYFLDGNESLRNALAKDENAFSTTWTRPKFSMFQE